VTPLLVALFWLSAAAVVYAYAGYPLALAALTRHRRETPPPTNELPTVTMIVPVHNERRTLDSKLANMRALDYPADRLDILFVSDGSTDGTPEMIRAAGDARVSVLELPVRGGKAGALNAGLEAARGEIVLFTDASILLESDAVRHIVAPFADPAIGCVSGEDQIAALGGEGLYGRYELMVRRLESRLHSIAGASGSVYAQRRALCAPFVPNLAPDFLSVLRTVEQGYRAVAAPDARGHMTAVSVPRAEFERKVRTLLRGITTLVAYRQLLNPIRYGWFALILLSHKLTRWLVPFFLIVMLATSAWLAIGSPWFLAMFLAQALFYLLAAAPLVGWTVLARSLPVKVAVYFTTVNLATIVAWLKYCVGQRQELWAPTAR
jgi:cellulose synthase/poly-beta-1,6-N-acetylglucosamine synthase-like glycosyltransferase